MFQRVVLVAIVATLMFVPAGALLAVLCTLVLDVSIHDLATFWGALSGPAGLFAWWLLAWLPASVYVAVLSRCAIGRGGSPVPPDRDGEKDCLP